MKYYNLQFYVDKLKNGEKFSLARYGDGELYCMWGKKGQNSNGCIYYPELRQALLDSMNKGIIYGLQRVLPQDEKRIVKEYPNIDWYDTEIFSIAVSEGKLYPLIEQLRNMSVTVIGNISIKNAVSEIIGADFIEVPPSNAFNERERVIKEVIEKDSDVFIFCCGMAANVFITDLHGKKDSWLIDLGHIFDPFTGNMSRCDLIGKSLEDIKKNLCE